jgi:hypothetical protein
LCRLAYNTTAGAREWAGVEHKGGDLLISKDLLGGSPSEVGLRRGPLSTAILISV